MCGFFTHGFWWEKDGDYIVVADWEINSHSKIREYRKDLIPANAQRWGFNPINGEPLTNESEPLPERVKDKICLLREMYFLNKESIACWMKQNYGKQDDKEKWDLQLPKMLDDFGTGLLSRKYYEQEIKYYEQQIKDYEQRIKNYEQEIKNYEQEIKYCGQEIKNYEQEIKYYEQRIKYCGQEIKYYEQEIKYYEQGIKNCTGTLDQMDIDKFIAYFLEHPNSFWANRKEERKVKYESFVRC